MCQTSEYFNTYTNTDSLIRNWSNLSNIRVLSHVYKQRLTCQGTDLTFQTCAYSNISTNTCSLVICQTLQTSRYFNTSTNTLTCQTFHTSGYFDIWLSAKRCANGGSDFWLSIKSVSNTVLLLLCVCVHNWSVSQWKQYDLQIWSSWRNIIFWKWKAPRNSTPENGHAHGECFRCFHSRTWWIKTLPQSLICTVHIKSIITKFCFWS